MKFAIIIIPKLILYLYSSQVSESWWDTVQGVDSSYGNALTASILSLQESYLALLNGDAS